MAGLREAAALAQQGGSTPTARRALLVQHERAVTARLGALRHYLSAIRPKTGKDDQRHSPSPHQEPA